VLWKLFLSISGVLGSHSVLVGIPVARLAALGSRMHGRLVHRSCRSASRSPRCCRLAFTDECVCIVPGSQYHSHNRNPFLSEDVLLASCTEVCPSIARRLVIGVRLACVAALSSRTFCVHVMCAPSSCRGVAIRCRRTYVS